MKERIQYVCLAKSIPEFDKRDGKLYTCSLGYSPQKGLIRLYPLPITGISKWHIYELDIERNKKDSRKESWRIASNSRHEHFNGFNNDIVCKGKIKPEGERKIIQFLRSQVSPSISYLNDHRKSIGVLDVRNFNPTWQPNSRFNNVNQIGLFEDACINEYDPYTKDSKEMVARILFKDLDGTHDLQLNEWQYFEYARNHGYNPAAFRYLKPNNSNLLLLGNMLQYQSNWMVLSVFEKPVVHEISLF